MTGIQGPDAPADVRVLLAAEDGVDAGRLIYLTLDVESLFRELVGGLAVDRLCAHLAGWG